MIKAIAIILQGTEHSSMPNKTIKKLLHVLGCKFQCCMYFIFAKAQFQLHTGSLINSSQNVNLMQYQIQDSAITVLLCNNKDSLILLALCLVCFWGWILCKYAPSAGVSKLFATGARFSIVKVVGANLFTYSNDNLRNFLEATLCLNINTASKITVYERYIFHD